MPAPPPERVNVGVVGEACAYAEAGTFFTQVWVTRNQTQHCPTPGGGGEQNLTQLKTKRDFISQTPDPTKPMLGPMRPHTRHISLLTLLLNFSCASGMRTIRASQCYKLGRPKVHSSNARMCTIRAPRETWGSECSHFLRASECAPFGRPRVHTSGVRMCKPWASDCAHLGLTHMHNSDVRTCTTRASERAHFGRCNSYFPGVQTFTARACERSHVVSASKCAQFVRPSVCSSSVELAQFGRPKVHTSHARTCTSPPRNVAA